MGQILKSHKISKNWNDQYVINYNTCTLIQQDWKSGCHSLTACIWNDYEIDFKWMQTYNKYWMSTE